MILDNPGGSPAEGSPRETEKRKKFTDTECPKKNSSWNYKQNTWISSWTNILGTYLRSSRNSSWNSSNFLLRLIQREVARTTIEIFIVIPPGILLGIPLRTLSGFIQGKSPGIVPEDFPMIPPGIPLEILSSDFLRNSLWN